MSRLCILSFSVMRAVILSFVALAVVESSASAAILNPGQTAYDSRAPFLPSFTNSGLPAQYNIPVLGGGPTVFPYLVGGSYTGSVTSQVLANAQGQLAFTYVFNNATVGAVTNIDHATLGDPTNPWNGITITDEGADRLGHSTTVVPNGWTDGNPFDIARAAANFGSGLTFDFNPFNNGGTQLNSPTVPNDTSALIWVATTAKRFTITNVGLIDGGTQGNSLAFAPVPEPSTIVLAILAVLGCGLSILRRRSATQTA